MNYILDFTRKAKEDLEKHLDEWGFYNPEVKEALKYRIMKKMQRKKEENIFAINYLHKNISR